MESTIRKPGALAVAALVLAACGGGGGGGGSSTDGSVGTGGGTGVTGDHLEVFEDPSSGLMGIHPAAPGNIITLDADADFSNVNSIPVLGATWNNGQTEDGYIRELVYQDTNGYIQRISTDASGGATPTPQRVSAVDSSDPDVCAFNIGQDFANVDNASVALQFCGTNEWWFTGLDWGASTKPVEFPGTPLVDLVDPGNGGHDGWLALDNGSIKHLAPDGIAVFTVSGTPTGITSATHLESIQTGEVLLNIDGDLWSYTPTHGLTDLGHAFTYGSETTDSCAGGPSTCPALHVVDDSELFFIDNDRLYRTDLANDQVVELDRNSNPPQYGFSGRRLAVGTDRVVWTYEEDPTPSSGDEETVIRSVTKDTGNGMDLDRVPLLPPNISAPNQPFMDRTGDWFFYTWYTEVDTPPTAVAVKMDNSAKESHAGAVWIGVSTNLISFAPLSSSLEYVYMVDGMFDTMSFQNKNLKAVSASSPGTTRNLGILPGDTNRFLASGGFNQNRLGFLFAGNGSNPPQQDVIFMAGNAAGSLQRITNTSGTDEMPAPFF